MARYILLTRNSYVDDRLHIWYVNTKGDPTKWFNEHFASLSEELEEVIELPKETQYLATIYTSKG